jgi:hypothetical protein
LLIGAGRTDEAAPLLAEAREVFDRLQASVWLERLGTLETSEATAAAS